MPIFTDRNRETHELVQVDLHSLHAEQRVWRIRFTGEIFVDYAEYLNRLDLYRQRIWKCSVSGKTNLTYEEAQVQEEKTRQLLDSFPTEFTELLCKAVQFAQKTLSELTKEVAQEIKNEIAKNKGKPLGSKRPPTHGVIRLKIKTLAEKHRSLWILRDGVAAKFSVSEEMPAEVQAILAEKKTKTKKRVREENEETADKRYPCEDQLVPPKLDENGRPFDFPPFESLSLFSSTQYTDILTIWYFCSCFSAELKLTAFPVTYLEEALQSESRTVLVDEIFISFLDVLRQVHYDSDDEDCPFPRSRVKHFRPQLLVDYIRYQDEHQDDGVFSNFDLKNMSSIYTFYRIDIDDKLKLLTYLVDQILNSSVAREAIKNKLEEQTKASRLIKEEEEKMNERVREKKDESKKLRGKIATLKEEMEKNPPNNENSSAKSNQASRAQTPSDQSVEIQEISDRIKELREEIKQLKIDREFANEKKYVQQLSACCIRFEPLGNDRFCRQYFWAPGSAGRIYVQTHLTRPSQISESVDDDGKEREVPPKKRRRISSLSEVDTTVQNMSTETNDAFEWAFLDHVSQLEKLFSVLDDRGVREKKLIHNLNLRRDEIIESMQEQGNDDGHVNQNLRRSSRRQAARAKSNSFMKYKNIFNL